MEFNNIRYQGVDLARDKDYSVQTIYIKEVRKHWWELWKPKQRWIPWKDIRVTSDHPS